MALFTKQTDKAAAPRTPSGLQPASSGGARSPMMAENRETGIKSAAPSSGRGNAYLDSASRVSGKLFFEGPAILDGEIDGEVTAKETVTIGESAVVTAQIKAASVIVSGKVSGDITATKRLEIRPSARVLGNLTSPVLVIHEGAHFEGHCAMRPAEEEPRKVAAFPKEERTASAPAHKQV